MLKYEFFGFFLILLLNIWWRNILSKKWERQAASLRDEIDKLKMQLNRYEFIESKEFDEMSLKFDKINNNCMDNISVLVEALLNNFPHLNDNSELKTRLHDLQDDLAQNG